jgi:hypothetical protein
MRRLRLIVPIAAVAVALIVEVVVASPAGAITPVRAFSSTSWWNTPLPADAPLHPNSAGMVSWLKSDNSANFLHLAGTTSTGAWGMPVYWADAGDQIYDVVQTKWTLTPEFNSLRIPEEAQPDPTDDAEMVIYDLEAGYVVSMYEAKYISVTDTWSAGGGSVYYLGSNGLHGSLTESDDDRNFGHRGVSPSLGVVRWDEINADSLNHVLKIAVNTTKDAHVFPMIDDEDGTTAAMAPPEGTRIRIKPSVDLGSLGLSAGARVIATALQKYGAVIGDQSGGNSTLKVENTVAEGRGWLWNGVLSASSLEAIPLESYEVIQHGYKPPTGSDGGGSDGGGSDGGGSDGGGFDEEPPPPPKVDVRKPNKKKVRESRDLRIVWDSEGEQTVAKLRYVIKGAGTKSIKNWALDDGFYRWNIPSKLEGKRIRIQVFVYDRVTNSWAWDVSRWVRVV